MTLDRQFSLVTTRELESADIRPVTCLILDQGAFPHVQEPLKRAISNDSVWHIVVVGERSADIEDEIDEIIVSVTSRVVMTSAVKTYDPEEIISLAAMSSDDDRPRGIIYIYDDSQPALREAAKVLAEAASALN